MSDICLPKDLDLSKISYGTPKQLDNGGRCVYISYSGKNLMIQTPVMHAPFGVSIWPGERGMPDKYSLDLSFADRDSRPGIQDFFEMLQGLSDQIISDALDNSNSWFKKKYPSRDVIDALFTSNIRYNKDKITGEVTNLYPPSFKLNLPYRDGAFNFPVYGPNKEVVNLMDIHSSPGRGKGSKVSAIIQCTSIWVAGGKFGLSWKVCQMRIAMPTVLKGYAFITSEEDDLVLRNCSTSVVENTNDGEDGESGDKEYFF
jgi:hypothetical protein